MTGLAGPRAGTFAGTSAGTFVGTFAVLGITLGVAWALKRFYSHAGFDQLGFVLMPTTRLAEVLSGVRFTLEPHHGYLSRDARFEIVPACAGVNFLIAAFVSLCLGLAPACANTGARVALVAGSAAAAWVATVLANATRIALAVRVHEAGVACGPLTPARLHCALGVAVYFGFLLALFALARCVARVPA